MCRLHGDSTVPDKYASQIEYALGQSLRDQRYARLAASKQGEVVLRYAVPVILSSLDDASEDDRSIERKTVREVRRECVASFGLLWWILNAITVVGWIRSIIGWLRSVTDGR